MSSLFESSCASWPTVRPVRQATGCQKICYTRSYNFFIYPLPGCLKATKKRKLAGRIIGVGAKGNGIIVEFLEDGKDEEESLEIEQDIQAQLSALTIPFGAEITIVDSRVTAVLPASSETGAYIHKILQRPSPSIQAIVSALLVFLQHI